MLRYIFVVVAVGLTLFAVSVRYIVN